MSSKARKISKNKRQKENDVQLQLLEQYFEEYGLMNHYQLWLTAKLDKTKPPRGLDLKIMFNPIVKLWRKIRRKKK
jgi:hypothetical protein